MILIINYEGREGGKEEGRKERHFQKDFCGDVIYSSKCYKSKSLTSGEWLSKLDDQTTALEKSLIKEYNTCKGQYKLKLNKIWN